MFSLLASWCGDVSSSTEGPKNNGDWLKEHQIRMLSKMFLYGLYVGNGFATTIIATILKGLAHQTRSERLIRFS